MKTTSLIAVVFALALSHTAEARHRSFGGGSDYDSNGQFGLGLELGEPTGLNGKLFLNPNQALDFGIGEVYHYYYGGWGGYGLGSTVGGGRLTPSWGRSYINSSGRTLRGGFGRSFSEGGSHFSGHAGGAGE